MATPHPNDKNHMGSDAAILARLAAIRKNQGLKPDPASDQIWLRRIRSGGVDVFGQARAALEKKARTEGVKPPGGGGGGGGGGGKEDKGEFASAFSIIKAFLQQYQLTFSESTVREWAGLLSDDPGNMVIIEEQIRKSKEFLARFPGLAKRLEKGFNQITVAEYLELEDSYKSLMRASGLPKSFYDSPTDFANFIASDLSPSELEFRIQRGVLAARQAPDEVKKSLKDFYGVSNTEGALTAYYLDPDKALPAIEREFATATVAGTGSRFGFDTTKDFAERLVSLGVMSPEQAQAGFTRAAGFRGLEVETITEREDVTDRDLVNAGFGSDIDSAQRLARRAQQRRSSMGGQGGGGAGIGSEGSGLGGARR
jgi:hypothetical protein